MLFLAIALAPLVSAAPPLPALPDLTKSQPPSSTASDTLVPTVAAPRGPAPPAAPSFGERLAAAASRAAAIATDAVVAVASALGIVASSITAALGSFVSFVLASLSTLWSAMLAGVALALADGAAAAEYASRVAVALGGLVLAFGGFAAREWRSLPANVALPIASAAGTSFLGTALSLYSRLAKSDLLANDARRGIFEFIQKAPGTTPTELAEQLALGWGTTMYHLARLEEAGFVSAKRAGNAKCYFAVGGIVPPAEQRTLAALRAKRAVEVARFVAEHPGATQKDLAAATGMSAALTSWHVRRLVADGVVAMARAGRSTSLRLADGVRLPEGAAS